MSVTSTSRRWAFFWFCIATILVPFLFTPALFILLERDYPPELGGLLALLGLVVWLVAQGAGLQPVEKDTAVIVRDATDMITVHAKRSYLFVPILQKVEAVLPGYPLTFEFPVEAIDTHTPGLAKISKITVRATCQITDPELFFRASRAFIDRIRQMEDSEKLRRTDVALWRKLLEEIAHVAVDDVVRDVVWKWQLYLQDPSLVRLLDYVPEKDGKPAPGVDPYSLSRNRKALADRVKAAVKARLDKNRLGFQIDPLVFESVEVDGEIIKRATVDRTKERERATHEAALLADAIREQGTAEGEVRVATLAKLLKVLIDDYKIPHTDPLIAHVVRSALYSDGEMLWSASLRRGNNGGDEARSG